MNTSYRRRTARTAATAAGLLVVSLLSGAAPGGAERVDASPALQSLQDAGVPEAGKAPPAPSPPRRLNSSLSMPYFSFAQSLNSRS